MTVSFFGIALSAISSAVALNATLTSLDLSGCKEELVRDAFQAIINHAQMPSNTQRGGDIPRLDLEMGEISSLLAVEEPPTGLTTVPIVRSLGPGLTSLKCSGEDHEILELIKY